MRKVLAISRGALVTAGVMAIINSGGSMAASAPPGDSYPAAVVAGLAQELGISKSEARERLADQDQAHETYKRLPRELVSKLAGHWFDAETGKLTVAVTSANAAKQAAAAGAEATLVDRSAADLGWLRNAVKRAASGVPGLAAYGVDARRNDVVVKVLASATDAHTQRFVDRVQQLDGVRVQRVESRPVQQSGEVNPGDGWWPGSETPCSVGFPAADANGGKHYVTAGHCTNDANQPAYGQSGQQNRLGTSNVGGTRSINGREGDMGVVAVDQTGWTLSPNVNTWGQPAVTVSGSAEAMIGDAVCHSGNTAPNWECGEVTKLNQTVDYGSVVVEGLTATTACSQGGDSGGAWLRNDKGVGLHEGAYNGNSCPAGDNAIFQPVNEALQKWNLTLLTGSTDPGGDTEAPTTPTGLRVSGTTSTSISLSWTASTDNVGVTGYEVYRGDVLASTVTGTSATVSNLAPNTEYSFYVVAVDAAGNNSKPTEPVTGKTVEDGTGGRTFTNNTAYPIRDYQVTISSIRSTATGAAANPVTVGINATHTCKQDLQIGVVSPSGRYYQLQRYGGDGWNCTPFPGSQTFTFAPVSGEAAGGTWTLRIGDNGPGDTGTLSGWSITV